MGAVWNILQTMENGCQVRNIIVLNIFKPSKPTTVASKIFSLNFPLKPFNIFADATKQYFPSFTSLVYYLGAMIIFPGTPDADNVLNQGQRCHQHSKICSQRCGGDGVHSR